MPIICPHCSTSYAIDPATLGEGRTVRCARCKETWVAKPEPAPATAGDPNPVGHAAGSAEDVAWHEDAASPPVIENPDAPLIESPPLAADWPTSVPSTELVPVEEPPMGTVIDAVPEPRPHNRRGGAGRRKGKDRRAVSTGSLRLVTSVAAMCALIGALMVWRSDVVRLMPQTALFYKTIGLDVNLRGLSFRDVRLGHETVEGQPVLIIEGAIVDELPKSLDVPRLRFVLRDAKGTAIYAWNTVPEQNVIQPGERVAFRSRLAQPPANARTIDVRFFNKRDLAAGAV